MNPHGTNLEDSYKLFFKFLSSQISLYSLKTSLRQINLKQRIVINNG